MDENKRHRVPDSVKALMKSFGDTQMAWLDGKVQELLARTGEWTAVEALGASEAHTGNEKLHAMRAELEHHFNGWCAEVRAALEEDRRKIVERILWTVSSDEEKRSVRDAKGQDTALTLQVCGLWRVVRYSRRADIAQRFLSEILTPLGAVQTSPQRYSVTLRAVSAEDLEDMCAGWRRRAAEVGKAYGWHLDICFEDEAARKWGVGQEFAFARKWPVAAAADWCSPTEAADFRMDNAPAATAE